MQKYKSSINQREAKELHVILSKIKEGLNACFLNLANLFYSKEEMEVYQKCDNEVKQIKYTYNDKIQKISDLEGEIKQMQQESQLYVDQLNQQLQEQFEQTVMYKAAHASMESEALARKKECNQLKKAIEKYETEMQEKETRAEIAD